MPKTIGGVVGWVFSTLIMVAVGVAILSRTPAWAMLFPSGK